MDKASIVRDAIGYVQELKEEERRLIAEVAELERAKGEKLNASEFTQDDNLALNRRRNKRSRTSLLGHGSPSKPSIEVMEVNALSLSLSTYLELI